MKKLLIRALALLILAANVTTLIFMIIYRKQDTIFIPMLLILTIQFIIQLRLISMAYKSLDNDEDDTEDDEEDEDTEYYGKVLLSMQANMIPSFIINSVYLFIHIHNFNIIYCVVLSNVFLLMLISLISLIYVCIHRKQPED